MIGQNRVGPNSPAGEVARGSGVERAGRRERGKYDKQVGFL